VNLGGSKHNSSGCHPAVWPLVALLVLLAIGGVVAICWYAFIRETKPEKKVSTTAPTLQAAEAHQPASRIPRRHPGYDGRFPQRHPEQPNAQPGAATATPTPSPISIEIKNHIEPGSGVVTTSTNGTVNGVDISQADRPLDSGHQGYPPPSQKQGYPASNQRQDYPPQRFAQPQHDPAVDQLQQRLNYDYALQQQNAYGQNQMTQFQLLQAARERQKRPDTWYGKVWYYTAKLGSLSYLVPYNIFRLIFNPVWKVGKKVYSYATKKKESEPATPTPSFPAFPPVNEPPWFKIYGADDVWTNTELLPAEDVVNFLLGLAVPFVAYQYYNYGFTPEAWYSHLFTCPPAVMAFYNDSVKPFYNEIPHYWKQFWDQRQREHEVAVEVAKEEIAEVRRETKEELCQNEWSYFLGLKKCEFK